MTRSTDITSFSEVRQNLRKHFDRLKKTGRPLYVTTKGRTEAVVLSPKSYDKLVERAERAEDLASLERGIEDMKAGRVRKFTTGISEVMSEFGPGGSGDRKGRGPRQTRRSALR